MTPPVLRFDELDSTNAEARRRAEAGETGPLWITAERQSAGRGRRGRAWETGVGNLAATLLTCTDRPPAEAAQLSFVTALAVHDLVAAYAVPETVRLKWPNDVLLSGRKVAGILVESGARGDGRLWLAIGTGVNLATPPVAPERPAAALADHLAPGVLSAPSPESALQRLAEAFEQWAQTWRAGGFEPIRAAWTARAWGLDAPCTARLAKEEIHGVAEALEADGALRLRLPSGQVRRITAGDVVFGEG